MWVGGWGARIIVLTFFVIINKIKVPFLNENDNMIVLVGVGKKDEDYYSYLFLVVR